MEGGERQTSLELGDEVGRVGLGHQNFQALPTFPGFDEASGLPTLICKGTVDFIQGLNESTVHP